MTLAARHQAGPPRVIRGEPCSVGALLAELPKAEAEALRGMLEDSRWAQNAIYDMIGQEGHEVGRQSIGRHRRRQCRCQQ